MGPVQVTHLNAQVQHITTNLGKHGIFCASPFKDMLLSHLTEGTMHVRHCQSPKKCAVHRAEERSGMCSDVMLEKCRMITCKI